MISLVGDLSLIGIGWLLGILTTVSFAMYLHLRHPHRKDFNPMPVIPGYQAIVDSINANTAAITALKETPTLPAGAADAQDVTDTETALQDAINAQNAALAPPAS